MRAGVLAGVTVMRDLGAKASLNSSQDLCAGNWSGKLAEHSGDLSIVIPAFGGQRREDQLHSKFQRRDSGQLKHSDHGDHVTMYVTMWPCDHVTMALVGCGLLPNSLCLAKNL